MPLTARTPSAAAWSPPELVFELDEPTFAPTYRTWTVEYTDGTSKVFEA